MDPSTARILIIDDQVACVQLLTEILRAAGFRHLLGSSDPSRALSLATAYQPDIVLLDLHMPGVDGFEVLRALRSRLPAGEYLPVLMLTADITSEVRKRALASGAQDFLPKPFDAVEVLLRIRILLETRALHVALRQEKSTLEQKVRERTHQLEEAQGEILERLAQAAELHDDDTGLHTRRVGESAATLAGALQLCAVTVDLIRRTAPLHDVGKIAVPDSVLRKPGPLSPLERAVMQQHTLAGARILTGGRTAAIRTAEQVALSHHERWDGTGYPQGLRAREIPLAARVVAVADVFDALTHDRPYRKAWPAERALAEVQRNAGTHFDPHVVEALGTCLDAGHLVA